MRRLSIQVRENRGQVALEYMLAGLMFAMFASLFWMFYQGFLWGNLYGGTGDMGDPNKAMGLERVVSLPFP